MAKCMRENVVDFAEKEKKILAQEAFVVRQALKAATGQL